MAIPPTSGPVYPHPLPLSDGDQTLSVELRETDDAAIEIEGGMVAARARQEGQASRVPLPCLRLRRRRSRATSELPDV